MKRELAFALESQSLLIGSSGRTRASKSHPIEIGVERCNNEAEAEPPESNLSIDQSRGSRVETGESNGRTVSRRSKRFKIDNEDIVVGPQSNGDSMTPVAMEGNREVNNDAPVVVPRRFTRSALKAKVGSPLGSSELANGNSESMRNNLELRNGNLEGQEEIEDAVLDGHDKERDVRHAMRSSTKKLEIKMSKKVAVKGSRMTVRELFQTGLLEGYPVFYNGGKKGTLRGKIKDIGILCSCSLCKGSTVVPASQFEMHARNSYRHAAEFICLENGKSLLEVLEACWKTSPETLEETIRSVIGRLPVKESFTCRSCMGSFLATSSANKELLCDSCTLAVKSEVNPTLATGVKTRSAKQSLSSKSSTSAEVHISSESDSGRKMKRKSSNPYLSPKSAEDASVSVSSGKGRRWKIGKPSSKSAVFHKCTGSDSVRVSARNKDREKMLKKLSRSVSVSKSSKVASQKSQWKITKKDLRFHKLVFEKDGLPEGTEVAYYSNGKKLLEGYKKGSGIFCRCCNSEVSPSTFEAHAGLASRKKPYGNIYTSNGVSLHEYAVSLLKGRKCSAKDNDDLCTICADGGNLVLCDGCPRAFHKECASLSSLPRGRWYCKYCQNMFQREKHVEHNANAVAAGRVSGVDVIEQITKRCIRIFRNPEEAEVVACVLCRGYEFSKSGFGPHTVILCDQCEREYHVGCLKENKMADLDELPKGKWFCCMHCKRINSSLQNLLTSGEEKLPDSLLDAIKVKQKDVCLENDGNFDVRWRLLSGKIASRETRLLLSEAVAIFHDRFDPIVDSVTGRDFIPSMVYGRNIRGQDLSGMYCALLTVNSLVVSVGILRVFGQDIAELPLVATRNGYQGKGYFQLLFSCIEKLLAFLNVKNFVLPAAVEAESIWTEKFGFRRVSPEQLSNYRRMCWQLMTFKGTSMLEKVVPECRIVDKDNHHSAEVDAPGDQLEKK